MTVRLLGIVAHHYPVIDGELALKSGLDPTEIPIDRLCNLAYYFGIRNAENDQDIAKFDAKLWRPPVGAKIKPSELGPWSPEAETQAFEALMRGTGQAGSLT